MDLEKNAVVENVQDDAVQVVQEVPEKVENDGDDNRQAQLDKALGARLQREREKAYQKAKQEAEAQYAPLREIELAAKQLYPDKTLRDVIVDQKVQQLMKDEGVTEGVARRLIHAELGISAKQSTETKPTKEEPKPERDPMLQRLAEQADDIKAEYGEDMVELLKANPDIAERVGSGELDLYKARREIQKVQKEAPPVVRTPHGTQPKNKGIKDMSAAQFAELERRIRNGETFS